MPMPVLRKSGFGCDKLKIFQFVCHFLAYGFRHVVFTSLVQQITECLMLGIPLVMSVLERCQKADREAYLYIFLWYMFH